MVIPDLDDEALPFAKADAQFRQCSRMTVIAP